MSRPRRVSSWNPCEEFATKDESERSRIVTGDGFSDRRVTRRVASELPELCAVQVRRFRLPYCEAAILELEEAGFGQTVKLLSELVELDARTSGNEVVPADGASRMALRSDKRLLKLAIEGLRSAEVAGKDGNSAGQMAALTETAIRFESDEIMRQRPWMAERLYANCLAVGARNDDDDGYALNIARYFYGRFILEKLDDPERALEHLERARTASEGTNWILPVGMAGVERETLHRACCALSHRALLLLSGNFRERDPQLAVRAATRALGRATDYGCDKAIASALQQLGTCQMSAGDARNALASLLKFLAIAKRIADPEGICDAHAELALVLKELEDREGTVRHLEELRRCATRYNLPRRLAQAHYCTGEYLLNESRADLATPHLEFALAQFASLGRRDETERSRCAAAISKGQEVIEEYIRLISRCQIGDKNGAIKDTCDWKNSRVKFWVERREKEGR